MSCCAAVACNAEVATETLSTARRLEKERIIATSVKLTDGTYKTDFIVPDMHCIACIGMIERGLGNLAGVLNVRANLTLSTVSVNWDPHRGDIVSIQQQLSDHGFENHLNDLSDQKGHETGQSNSLLVALAVAGFAAANVMLLSVSVWAGADVETARLFNLISGLIAVPAVLFAGQPFFRSAATSLAARRLNMDVPISLAVLLALGMSIYESMSGGIETYFDASVTLLFFLLIGRYLDTLMRQKARSSVERLASLSSKFAVCVLPDESISHLPLNEVTPGMRLRVFPGERFPVNAKIISGSIQIDSAHVTGESDHRTVRNQDLIEAGSLNLSSVVDCEAVSDAEHSFLGEMQAMIREAEQGRGEYLRIADRMAQIYAPAVHLLAFIAFLGWMVLTGGDWRVSLYTAIAVLIVTCPCALGLAVPVAHVIAANRLMQNGILMRDGSALERLAEVNSVVFDKTGTLTNGAPEVVSVSGEIAKFAPIIKAMARTSAHPISKSVDHYLHGDVSETLESIREVPGFGIEAMLGDKQVRFGKQNWVMEIAKVGASGKDHSVSFAVEGEDVVHFDTQDTLRKDAFGGVQELARAGLSLEILSGDHERKAASVAASLNIPRFAARQTPKQKIDRVKEMQAQGYKVLMAGDGINDAPALAEGHVSFVPASASDIGRHSADFVFTRESLLAIPFAQKLSVLTSKIVKQNFALAIAYNCIAVPLAMAGYITPLVAAIAMSASSIVVVANSFRINFQRISKAPQKIETPSTIKTVGEAAA